MNQDNCLESYNHLIVDLCFVRHNQSVSVQSVITFRQHSSLLEVTFSSSDNDKNLFGLKIYEILFGSTYIKQQRI